MAALVAAGGLGVSLAAAQIAAAAQSTYPIFPFEDFVRMMKSVGANWDGTTASIAKGDFAETKLRLTRSREQLAVTITFWRDHKKNDAVKMLRATLARMDELDVVLSTETVDARAAAAAAAGSRIADACETCHSVYREQDPVTKAYRLRPGSLP